jgi:hypothetical protein
LPFAKIRILSVRLSHGFVLKTKSPVNAPTLLVTLPLISPNISVEAKAFPTAKLKAALLFKASATFIAV